MMFVGSVCVVSENTGSFKNFLLSVCVSCNRTILTFFRVNLLNNVELGSGEALSIELQQY